MLPISPTSETGMFPSSKSRVSQASGGGTGISSQRAAVPTGTIQQEGIPPQMPELSTQSELTLTFMKSYSLKTQVHTLQVGCLVSESISHPMPLVIRIHTYSSMDYKLSTY